MSFAVYTLAGESLGTSRGGGTRLESQGKSCDKIAFFIRDRRAMAASFSGSSVPDQGVYSYDSGEESADVPQFDQLCSDTDDEREGIEIITVGIPFEYTVPHFPVIRCKLRQITFRVELPDGSVKTYDGFIRDDDSLGVHSCPALIRVKDYFVEVQS